METYTKPKDPSETDVFAFDWSPRLGDGETISSVTAALAQAAGCTILSATNDSKWTRVTLSGGTAGGDAIWTALIATSGSRTIEEAFRVAIVDTVLGAVAETEAERITREIVEAVAMRQTVALGQAVTELSRDGRRITKAVPTLAQIEAHIRNLRSELTAAQIDAGTTPTRRRRAIGLGWRN